MLCYRQYGHLHGTLTDRQHEALMELSKAFDKVREENITLVFDPSDVTMSAFNGKGIEFSLDSDECEPVDWDKSEYINHEFFLFNVNWDRLYFKKIK